MYRKASVVVLFLSLIVAGYLLAGVVMNRQQTEGDQPYRQMGVFTEVLQHISDDYVTTPNMKSVSDGALHGLVESLDADSSYLNPAEYKAFLAAESRQNPATLGMVVSKRFGYANVVDVRPGGPADKAGISRGDFIEAIAGQGTRDLSLPAIHNLLSGDPGTQVEMSVVRAHRAEPDKLTLTREVLTSPPLTTKLYGNIGYIAVPDFSTGRSGQLANALRTLARHGANKWIIDVRDNGAGEFTEAEAGANLFLDHGMITWLQGQKYPRKNIEAQPGKAVTTDPVVVLINAGTSGPAEVFSAAVKDDGRGQLVGDKTYGDAAQQKLLPVGDGSALYLSVARYYTPGGKAVQDGIAPNVQQVRYAGALPDEDFPPEGVPPSQDDLQLDKALQLMGGQAPAQASAQSAGK